LADDGRGMIGRGVNPRWKVYSCVGVDTRSEMKSPRRMSRTGTRKKGSAAAVVERDAKWCVRVPTEGLRAWERRRRGRRPFSRGKKWVSAYRRRPAISGGSHAHDNHDCAGTGYVPVPHPNSTLAAGGTCRRLAAVIGMPRQPPPTPPGGRLVAYLTAALHHSLDLSSKFITMRSDSGDARRPVADTMHDTPD
jgi:hypothetical protein